MIKALYSSEFDLIKGISNIKLGCVITASYPLNIQSEFHELASYMIPDGVHKIKKDKFFFKTGRIKFIEGEVQTYHFDFQWSPILQSKNQKLIYIEQNFIKIKGENQSEWLDINLSNSKIEVISHDFVQITLNPNLIYGIRGKFTQDYYLTCIKNKKDSSIKRGSLIRSIAICSSDLIFLGTCDQLIEQCLEQYFDQVGLEHWESDQNVTQNKILIQKILEQTFNNLQQESAFYKFSHSLLDYSSKEYGNLYSKRADGLTINASVLNLIEKFQMKTRIIYRALLQQKRIIFLCHECNNSDKQLNDDMYQNACNLILSLSFLVSPLNIIQNIQGYKSLLDQGWEQSNNWITIVSNPIFEYRKEWWDVFVDINACKIIESKTEQSLYLNNELDIDFFQSLITLIQTSHINELQARQILSKYTSSIIGNLPQTLSFKSYRRMRLKELCSEQQFHSLLNILAMVKLQKSMEDLELLQMYESLIDCLNSTMIFKEFFKLFTESNYDYSCFGIGTLCSDLVVQEKCREFLKMMESIDKQLMKKVNLFFII